MGKNGKSKIKFRPFAVQVGNTIDLSSIPNDSNEERSSYSSANNRRQNQRDRPDMDEERASRGPWRNPTVNRSTDSYAPSLGSSNWRQGRNEGSSRGDFMSRRGNDSEYTRDSSREENDGEKNASQQQENSRGDNSSNLENGSNGEQARSTVNRSWYEDTTSNDSELSNARPNRQEASREVPDRATQKYIPPRSSYNSQNNLPRQKRYEDNGGNDMNQWRQGGPRLESNTRDNRFNARTESREGGRRYQPSSRPWNKDNSETEEPRSWRTGNNPKSSSKDVRSLDSSKNEDRRVNSNESLENVDTKAIERNSFENDDANVNSGNTSESETEPKNYSSYGERKNNSKPSSDRRSHANVPMEKEDRRESFKSGKSIFLGRLSEEQERFVSYLRSKDAANFNKVKEEEQDLFNVGNDYALAHCVAEDMNMGSGIAVEFRVRFKKVPELLDQRAESGDLAFLKINDRFIYYLVTKKRSQGKPTYDTIWSSLLKLRSHMKKNNVTKLALPRIGCGLDRLDWDHVKPMLEFLFKNEQVDILVCNFQPDGLTPKTLKKCRVVFEPKPITEIDSGTIIIYFASKDGKITENMKKLDEKFKCLAHFEKEDKDLGKPVRLVPMFNKNYILYGCIVKDKYEDPFSFVSFASCLHSIVKNYKIDNLFYIAFQNEVDDLLNAKILNLMKHSLKEMDIYICGSSETPSNVED